MLKAVAIDDESHALEVIKNLAADIPFVDIKAVFTDALAGMAFMQQEKIDLLFLDIQMPDITGIELLQALPVKPMVIFTTAYSEHAVNGFELQAIDYLLKPFSLARFAKACNRALEQYGLKNPSTAFIFIKSGYEQIRVELNDIRYAEVNGNYMQFVLGDKKISSRLSMAEALDILPAADFVRIHRSYIVNKKQLLKTGRRHVLIGSTELPVGDAYAQTLQQIIHEKS